MHEMAAPKPILKKGKTRINNNFLEMHKKCASKYLSFTLVIHNYI